MASSGWTRLRCWRRSTRWSRWRPAWSGSTTARPKDLTKSIEGSLTKGRGKVIADENSNSLIITDTRSKVANIADFVRGLDIRTPQVSIKAKIVFVDRTDIEELGIKYDLGTNNQFFNKLIQRPDPNGTAGETYDPDVNIVDLGGNSVSAIGNASGTIVGSALDLVFSTAFGGFTLTSFLSALERQDLSDIQAEPVITTLDNRKADILVGEETPVRVIDAGGQARRGHVHGAVQGDRYPAHRDAARHQQPPDRHGAAHRAVRHSGGYGGRPRLHLLRPSGPTTSCWSTTARPRSSAA